MKDYLPYIGAAFIIGMAAGALLNAWAFVVTFP